MRTLHFRRRLFGVMRQPSSLTGRSIVTILFTGPMKIRMKSYRKKSTQSVSVTVWIGVSASGLVGPFFFEGTVTGDSYVSMLNNNFLPSVENWPLGEMWFQQDGAPPHYSIAARNWLNDKFPNRWIGRRGSIEYPPRSPDLTPPDFFLWGVLKNSVYAKKPRTKDQLVAVIMNTCTEISEDLCRSVCYSVVRRTAKCIEEGGQHFEHLLR